MKTKEKPRENNTKGIKFIFFLSSNSFKDAPETKEIYPGINGKTHGDKKLINPAPNAIINSIILNYSAIILIVCDPKLSTVSSILSPSLRNTGGFIPRPTPGGVPVVTISPGINVIKFVI